MMFQLMMKGIIMNQKQYANYLDQFIFLNYRTQGKAASAWGVSGATVSKVLAGSMRPTESMLQNTGHNMKVSKVTKVDIRSRKKEACSSCDKDFIPQENNDRPQGWFCDKCLTQPAY